MKDPYQILGLSFGANDEDVKRAYRKLAMQYHPDRNPGDKDAEEHFKEINAAHDAIKNGWRPGTHDPFHHFRAAGGTADFGFGFSGNLNDLLSALHAQHARRNRDIEVQAQITLEEAFSGTELNFTARNDTKTLIINVKVPPGVDTGSRIRVPQAGDDAYPSMTPGDLFVVIHVTPHSRLVRRGKNLLTTASIDLFDMLLGTSIKVISIDGKEIQVTVPPDSRPGQHLRLPGLGMPVANETTRGDMLIGFDVVYPVLSDEQRALLAQVRAASPTKP